MFDVTWIREAYGRYRLWYVLSGLLSCLKNNQPALGYVLGNESNLDDMFALICVVYAVECSKVNESNSRVTRPRSPEI